MLRWSSYWTDICTGLCRLEVGRLWASLDRICYVDISRQVNRTERRLGEAVVEVGDLTANISLAETNTSQSLERLREQVEGLVLNRHCVNRWNYHHGTCYYFSLPSETETWAGAQVADLKDVSHVCEDSFRRENVKFSTESPIWRCQRARLRTISWPESTGR